MARRYELITELYERTRAAVTSPQEWQKFLATAYRNYKLPFDEQLLLFAQRPDATAVLEIERWNKQFGRWVNRGATGIAVFDRDAPGRARLKYYFDISDTHPGRFARRVPLWQVRSEHEAEITEALENSFGELADKSSFAEALLSAAKNAVEDNLPDYFSELKYYKENSLLEELDDFNLEVSYRNAVRNSVGYMLLARCGINPALYFTDDDFRGVLEFDTPQVLNALGVAIGDIGQMCLSEIARTVTALERQASLNRTVAQLPDDAYPIARKETRTQERSDLHERDHIQNAGQLSASEPASSAGAGGDDWEIRPAASQVPAGASQGDVHQPADQRQADRAFAGDRADRSAPGGTDHGADGESRGRDGADEGRRPDEVGGADEQHPAGRGGDRTGGTDLQLKEESSDENAGDGGLPAFLDEELINAILSNPDDDLKYKKAQIEMYFAAHPDIEERAEYLKGTYPDRFTELLVGTSRKRVGYHAQEDGLLLWAGFYLSRTSESVFSWQVVAELTAQVIDKGEYRMNSDSKGLKTQEAQQLSLFDFAEFSAPEQAAPAEPVSYGLRYSQQVIDEALCIGANDRNSRLMICAYFMKDKPLADNASFLMEHYGENGAGVYLNDRQYAIWYNAEGIRLSTGDSAQGNAAMLISWEDAARRIRELLDAGRYMPQAELDRVTDFELQEVADSLWYLRQDFSEEAREQNLLPEIIRIYASGGGFPEQTAQIKELLKQPEALQGLVEEVRIFISAYEGNRDLLRFHFHRPRRILERLTDLQREPVRFTAAEDYDPQRHFFISMDEIDKLLRSSSPHYRLGVYAFYLEHPDTNERAKYLANYHGDSGHYGGNDGISYGSKGLSFSHGDITAPYAKLDWSWNKTARRIAALIENGSFLSEEDRAAMPDYERRELSTVILRAFYDLPEEHPRPFIGNPISDYWEAVREIQEQLTDPVKVEAIYQMLISAADGTNPEDRYYQDRQDALSAFVSYREGIYSLFGEKREPIPAPSQTQEIQPETKEQTDLEKAVWLINDYCQETFESDADFDDLSHVDLAYSSTGDGKHPIEVYADLVKFRLVYTVDKEAVYINECQSLAELNGYLAGLSFDTMIADAEDIFMEVQQGRNETEQTEPFIHHFYVIPDLNVTGQLEVQTYSSLEEAYEAYSVLPTDRQKALGIQNTMAMPGSLDFLQCRDSVDTLVEDYRNVEGWDNSEIAQVVEMLRQQLGRPLQQEQPAPLAPPKPRRERVAFAVLHPEIPAEKRYDFRITDSELGYGTRSEKYAANVAAIRTLKQIEAEERLATPEEQEILSRYVGWGGLSDCFDERHGKYLELKSLLNDEEYAAARASSLTAFYTSPVIIGAMYDALFQMGFQGGNILEPACGVGNFIGMLPEGMAGSRTYGVEIDSISGRIAQQLYQNSQIAVNGFEKVQMPDSFFDVAVGNVPFGDFKVMDKKYDKHHWLIHDYFFGKTLDKVRPGGIVAFITSKGTMDKENSAVRKYLAQRADLIGVIRLPDNAFKQNAGTEVTSDILFLQKRDRMTDIEPDWVHLETDQNGIRMNAYFVQHPEMVLGNMVMETGRFGEESACKAYEDGDLAEQLRDAIMGLHAEITAYEVEELEEDEEDRSIPADPTVRNFSFCLTDGELYFRENSRMYPVSASVTEENRIRGMITIRDCVRRLIELQTEDYPEADIQAEQGKLNRLYDDYTAKYGRITSRGNSLAFGEDASYCLLCSLEVLDEEGGFKRKADMFTRRTIRPHVPVTTVDTASEALAVSISEKARVDMAYMTELSSKSEAELETELSGVIFRDIRCAEEAEAIPRAFVDFERFSFVTADEYLSGNVRRKLRMAKAMAEARPDLAEQVQGNITALEAVQPVDLTAGEIGVRIGVNWIPTEIYEQFMYELFGTGYYGRDRIHVLHSKATGEWNITNKNADSSNVKSFTTYGTKRVNAYHILEQTLNQKDVRVFDYIYDENGNKKAVLNKKETAIAQDRQELIKAQFAEWIWKDIDRREQLCRIYNETFNSIRPREYDGQHIRFSGMNPEITLRKHQIDAIAHIMYGGNTLLAHEVGAGKTYEMVAAAMESKRLGLCTKSLIVVPNHITEQWSGEWLQLYPSANILVATKKDFETKNRKKFCARIATGDYDAVIIGHSQFEKIPMSAERQEIIIQRQIDEIMDGIDEAKRAKAERYTVKQLERTKKSLEIKMAKLNDQSRKDSLVTFEELGVDRVFIDESHFFKNLFLATKMRNVGGIAQTEAQKSSDLFMKCQYLDEITGGRGVVFATGTPISNSMVELYTIQRYLQYHTLEEMDMLHFDDWAAAFGETITAIELSPEGSGYRAKTRFAKFYNLPELMSTFKLVADIQTADMLKLPVPKANFHTEVIKPSEIQQEMIKGLAERAEKIRAGGVDPKVDNMLRITNDGRKLALDMRLINPLAADDPEGKVSVCAGNVHRIWEQTTGQRGTQLVFCDLSTPKGDGSFNVYDDLKQKLMAEGVPEGEIAYIHDANTEARKKELFAKVRAGQVRILMGSTQKMGAGTNVQDRLVALHDLDCPWRPSDLAQRLGRIVRQGNNNDEVDIYHYVTEGTFDAYLYQLVENKQKFIAQIMTSKSPVRVADDIDETALSYSEIKALATGNPLIIEKCNLDMEVGKLNVLKASHLSQKYALEEMVLKKYPKMIQDLKQRILGYEQDAHLAGLHPKPKEGFAGITLMGKELADKEAAGKAIIDVCSTMTGSGTAEMIGEYRGFFLSVTYDGAKNEYQMHLEGTLSHTAVLGADVFGNITRIDNVIDGIAGKLDKVQSELEDTETQMKNAKEQMNAPFAKEAELKEKEARLKELNILLNMDEKDRSLIDEVPEDEPMSVRDRNNALTR
jgi:N12 class adenine-specific DNA methylase